MTQIKLEAKVEARTSYSLEITRKELIELVRAAGYKIPQEATLWIEPAAWGVIDDKATIRLSWKQ